MRERDNITFSKAWSVLWKIALGVGTLWLLYYLRNVLIPFVVAFLLAYLLNPIVKFFEKYTKNRLFSVVLCLLSLFLVLSALFVIVAPEIYLQTKHLFLLLKGLAQKNNINAQFDWLPNFVTGYISKVYDGEVFSAILSSENLYQTIEKISSVVVPQITSFFSQTINIIISGVGFAIVLLYLIFIMLDYENINNGWHYLIPQKYKGKVYKFAARFEIEMHRYFRGQVLIATIVGVLFSIGFSILGLPMAIVLGLFLGFLNLIPYMQVLGFVPAFLLAIIHSLESNTPFWLVLLLTASIFVVIQIIQDLFLTPKIMGKNTGLNPAMILLSLSIWGKMLGFLGLLAPLPFTCLVTTYYSEFLKKQDVRENKNKQETDVKLNMPNFNKIKDSGNVSVITNKIH